MKVRRYGIEIEFLSPVSGGELEARLIAAGISAVNTNAYHARVPADTWRIGYDASIQATGRFSGLEIVSPPLRGSKGIDQLKTVCRVLNEAGCKVNSSCGLHVHHDATHLNVRWMGKILQFYADNEHNFDQLVSKSRRDNISRWCQSIRTLYGAHALWCPIRNAVRMAQLMAPSRYYKLNLYCYPVYNTLENRQHQGTLNAKKIQMWIYLMQCVIRNNSVLPGGTCLAGRIYPADDNGLATMLSDLGLKPSEVRWWMARKNELERGRQ